MRNGQKQDTSQTSIEAIISPSNDSPNDAPSAATSQSDEITNLKRKVERITAERDRAVWRASARHKEMMHANRAAERAITALHHETLEKEGQKIRMTALISSYNIRIQTLEQSTRHTEDNSKQVQDLENANATLSAALTEQREATTEAHLQLSSQTAIQDSLEVYKTRMVKEIEQVYKRRLTAAEKRISDHATHKAEIQSSRFKEMIQSLNNENQGLREQLSALQRTVQWHKAQTKQKTPHNQSSHMVSDIHTGVQLQGRHDSAQVKATPKKRKRSESATLPTGRNSLPQIYSNTPKPTSERQHGHFNPDSSGLPTTPTRQMPGSSTSRCWSQRTVTPTRRNTNKQNQQLSVNTNTAQATQYTDPQGQLTPVQALDGQYQPDFFQFLKQMNITRLNAGLAQVSAAEAMLHFNTYTTCMKTQSPFIRTSFLESHNPMLQQQRQQVAGRQVLSQNEAPKSLCAEAMLDRQALQGLTPLQDQLPLLGENKGMQQTIPVCGKQQLAHGDSHESNAYDQQDLMSLRGPSLMEGVSGVPRSTSLQTQGVPSQSIGDIDYPVPAHDMSSQSPYIDFQIFSEISQESLDINQPRGEGNASVWVPSVPSRKGDLQSTSNEMFVPNGLDLSSLWNNSNLDHVAKSENVHDRLSIPAYLTEAASDVRSHQETYSDVPQQVYKHNSVGQHHNANSQHEYAIPSVSFSQIPVAELSVPTPRVKSLPCSPAPTPHPKTARKYPTPAPSAISDSVVSGRSTTSQAVPPFPVCLHCHENWWNESCDVGEPCRNCIGSHTACERPKCLSFPKGMCSNARCARVHEGDLRFDFVIDKPKTLKRKGKKDEKKLSPVERALQRG